MMTTGGSHRPHVVFSVDGMGIGGTELNAFRTAVRLPQDQTRVTVVCFNAEGPLRREYEAAGIHVETCSFPSFLSLAAVREFRRLKLWLAREGVDVVHSHDIYSNIFTAGAGIAAGGPVVITSRRWGIEQSTTRGWGNRLTNRRADAVITNSSRGVDHLIREGVRQDRIVHLPNFVEDEAFAEPTNAERAERRHALGIPPDAKILGAVANLNPWKGYSTLVRAFAQTVDREPEWRLVALGEGPERARIEALAETLGVRDRIHLPGRVPSRPNPHVLFDLSTLLSPDEGSPNSLLEAMAAGRAVLATEVGGIPDLVEHEINGLLVPPDRPDPAAGALLRLMGDEKLRARMGAEGRRRARARHSPEIVVDQLVRLYRTLLENRGMVLEHA